MRPMRPLTLATAALLGLAPVAPTLAAPGARGADRYDGTWSIEVLTERGDCDRAYRYGIVIEQGQARYAGGTAFTVSGRVQPNGAVRGSISRGSSRAEVVGRLSEGTGTGTWSTAGARTCGGRWNAERRSWVAPRHLRSSDTVLSDLAANLPGIGIRLELP